MSEASVIKAARRGSPSAVEALVREHWDAAYRTAYLVLQDTGVAEDVTQEAMLAALKGLGKFDRRRPFAPWLRRIVVNRALDSVRARDRRRETLQEDPHGAMSGSEEAYPRDELDPPSLGLITALGSLGAEDRAIVVMRHLLGYRADEIGAQLGLSAVAVRTRLSRALARLRAKIDNEEGNPE